MVLPVKWDRRKRGNKGVEALEQGVWPEQGEQWEAGNTGQEKSVGVNEFEDSGEPIAIKEKKKKESSIEKGFAAHNWGFSGATDVDNVDSIILQTF